MDTTLLIFWIVGISTLSTFVFSVFGVRSTGRGWTLVSGIILILLFLAWHKPQSTYAAALFWLAFILVPGILAGRHHSAVLQQNYDEAYRISRQIAFLHPFDGWPEQPQINRALSFAQAGNIDAARKILGELESAPPMVRLTAVTNLYRMTGQWRELLQAFDNAPSTATRAHFIPTLLRAHAEVGDLDGMLDFYEANQSIITNALGASLRDSCRLVLFAFGGRPDLVESLFADNLSILPEAQHQFWVATAELASGNTAAAEKLRTLLPSADAPTRVAIERRLAEPLPKPAAAGLRLQSLIEDAALEARHEQTFGTNPQGFTRSARATQTIIALNCVMFLVEILNGGTDNQAVLLKLGALNPILVIGNHEAWRLITSLFLHFGPAHIIMNMAALSTLGPFVEFALGARKFVVLYLVCGIGSMYCVLRFSHSAYQVTAGASGSIMALVGATAALMLKGWLRDKASPARRRFKSVLIVLALQSVVDYLTPQISMTAHVSGALLGFVLGLFAYDHLPTRAGGQS